MARRSVALTGVIIVGLLLAILGAVVTVLGTDGVALFEFSAGENTLKTDSIGLAVLGIGALFVLVGTLKAEKAEVLGAEPPRSPMEKLSDFFVANRWIPLLLLVAATILLLISIQ